MEGNVGTSGEEEEGGTVDQARNRVLSHFEQLRETLDVQQATAMTTLDTHIRERLCTLRQLQEDLTTSMSQVNYIYTTVVFIYQPLSSI
jgi:tripartite motif-containing protein 23